MADIRQVPYKQKSYTPEELLSMNPSFPVNKFIPSYIQPNSEEPKKEEKMEEKKEEEKEKKKEEKEEKKKKKEEKKKEKEEKKGGGLEQIINPYTLYPSFVNEYLKA